MLEHTPKSSLNETPVKCTALQREYSLTRSSYDSGLIFSVLSDETYRYNCIGWKQVISSFIDEDGCKESTMKEKTNDINSWSFARTCFRSDRRAHSHNTKTHSTPQQGALISLQYIVQEVYLHAVLVKHL